MKKAISVLLCLCLALSVFTVVPFAASAAEVTEGSVGATSGTTGSCIWSLDDEGNLTISGNGTMKDYSYKYSGGTYITTAPWGANIKTVVIEGGVTSIGKYAFYGCINLTSVTIGNSVTSIGWYAFKDCTGLTSVTIPDSVTSIGVYAFYWCRGLTSVTIPDSVKSIGEYAFYWCRGLTSVTIPDSVTSIGNSAFCYCTGLTSVTIPDSVTSIGYRTFNCTGLRSVTIPDSVTSIGERAFYDCNSLQDVYYGGSYENWENIKISSGNEALENATIHYMDSNSITVQGEQFTHDLSFFAKHWNSANYSPELAHLMMTMANAAYDKSKVMEAYQELGLSDCIPLHYDDDWDTYDRVKTCFSIGSAEDEFGNICLLVTIRGSGDITDLRTGTLDWIGNLDINSASQTTFGTHNDFDRAAGIIYDCVVEYLSIKYNKSIYGGGIKCFVTGHSRGAAVANLLETKLAPNIGNANLYGYNFAVPDTIVATSNTNLKGFRSIFNVSNLQDPVSFLPGHVVDVMFSLKQLWETGKVDNRWSKWGISLWFGGGAINASAHDPVLYLLYMRERHPFSSYTENPQFHSSVTLEGWGPFIHPSYKLYATYCPVDVELVDKSGNVVASVINGEVNYHTSDFGDVIIITFDNHKAFAVPSDSDYTLRIAGTDEGKMDYYVAEVDVASEDVASIKAFENVTLENGKEMTSVVTDYLGIADTQLFVVGENNCKTKEILSNGSEVNPIIAGESSLVLTRGSKVTLTAESKDAYRWYSTDNSIATVENEVVKIHAVGEANIIAETVNGARAICHVSSYVIGDTDNDSIINIRDVTAIQRHIAELNLLTEKQLAAADTNGDGKVDINDATHLQRYLAEYDVVLGKQNGTR